MKRILCALVFMMLTLPLSGCLSTEDEEEPLQKFPEFSRVADNSETYDNARMAGAPFIVMFSAEWCNSPCYTTMHAIWSAKPNLPVLVMSTDPVPNASGMTLSDWHESADAYDDDDNDSGVSLTTYAFMKGSDVGNALGITKPGSLAFINAEGEITYLHEGRFDDQEKILMHWVEAGG